MVIVSKMSVSPSIPHRDDTDSTTYGTGSSGGRNYLNHQEFRKQRSSCPQQQQQATTTVMTKVRDEQVEHYLQAVQGYMPDVKLRIKRWKPDYYIRYQLVDEDPKLMDGLSYPDQ